jgi:AcrR family transcriptional regulator
MAAKRVPVAHEPEADDVSARQRILSAATQLFAENGFDRTSTARIATAAGVPHGLVFYHFKTKIDLLLATIGDVELSEIDAGLPPIAKDQDLAESVAQLWTWLSTVLAGPTSGRRILVQEVTAHPQVREQALYLQGQLTDIVARQLALASRGDGPPSPAHRTAATLLCVAAGFAPLLGAPADALLEPKALADLIVRGLQSP